MSRESYAVWGVSPFDISVCLLMAIFFWVSAILPLWDGWAVDFSAYYYAGHFYGTGQHDMIYAGPPDIIGPEMPLEWQQAVASSGHPKAGAYPYIYLPWVAALMAPVANTVSPLAAMNAVLLVNGLLLLGSSFLAWRIIGRGKMPLAIWMAASVLMLITLATSVIALYLGQVQILVYAAVLLAFDRLQAGKESQAGLALALAACLKITPAAFAIIFLWNRNWKALAAFLAACLGFAATSIALIGWPLHAQYFDLMARLNATVFMANVGISAEGFLYQIVEILKGTAPLYLDKEHSVPKPLWIELAVKGGFVAGLVWTWIATRKLPKQRRIAFQLFALAVLVPLMAPLGWVHYYLIVAMMLPVFLNTRQALQITAFAAFVLVLNVYSMSALVEPGYRVMWQFMAGVPVMVLTYLAVLYQALQEQRSDPNQKPASESP